MVATSNIRRPERQNTYCRVCGRAAREPSRGDCPCVYGDFRAAAGMLSLQPGNRSPVVQVTGKRQIGESHARPNSPIACPVRWFFQARSAGIMVGSAHCGCGDPLPVFPDALCGQMNMSIARIRNLLYRVARYLGDVNTLQRGRVSTRIIRRVAGLSSERFLLR
jgi:hypothetical protein